MPGESNFSILVIDDEKSNLDVLNYILKSKYTVYTAKSGQSGLKRACKYKPDLILLDILMPGMNGFDVLAELKNCELTCDIPVIFITGLDTVESEEKGLSLGAVDYIIKPFHASIVRARVKAHLQIVKHIRKIENLRMIDSLTDIPNRRCFDYHINAEWSRAIREQSSLSVLFLDVDKFKHYNDTYGHLQGDVLLRMLSKIFVSSLKRPTDIVARYGGDEFAFILPNTDLKGAMQVSENIRANLEEEREKKKNDNAMTNITISIGVACIIPTLEDNVMDFLDRSDKALYQAKNLGRNRICSAEPLLKRA